MFSIIYSLNSMRIQAYNVYGGAVMPKKIFSAMLHMCPAAWYIFMLGIRLCVILLIACVVVLANAELYPDMHSAFLLSSALNETAQSVLLISVIFSVLLEDVSTHRS